MRVTSCLLSATGFIYVIHEGFTASIKLLMCAYMYILVFFTWIKCQKHRHLIVGQLQKEKQALWTQVCHQIQVGHLPPAGVTLKPLA